MPAIAWRSFRLSRQFKILAAVGLVLGLSVGYLAGHRVGFQAGADHRRQSPNGSILCKPGPWGDLSYIPFTIAAPDDLLPVRAIEAQGTRWFFKGYTADSFVSLLQSTNLTADQQHALLTPAVFHVQPDGVSLTPPPDLVIAIPDEARARLYQVLAQFEENESEIYFIHQDTIDERFTGSGVSLDTLALFKRLSYQSGDYFVFSGLSALLSRLPTYQEKLQFVKALSRQHTMLLRLHITPKSDIQALTEYWGKGCWNTDVGTIMQSLTTIQTGTWMNILMVLPPLPTAEIYDYPVIANNPLDGPAVNRDCHWSSLNFFRDVANPDFGKAEYVLKELKENYALAPADPRYGDVVVFSKPDGSIVHSAVYIADDICFTKNGSGAISPWMLATIPDLLDQYSFMAPGSQALTVQYFRSKRL
jgi:hypothetical protein